MFESSTLKLLQAENAALRGQVSDLHSRIYEERKQAAEERKMLIDRIVAMASPVATAAIARAEGKAPEPMRAMATKDNPALRNWPQGVPDSRPNISVRLKEAQLATKAASIEEATDLERSVGS